MAFLRRLFLLYSSCLCAKMGFCMKFMLLVKCLVGWLVGWIGWL